MTLDILTAVFGWMALLNIGYLLLATLCIVGLQSWMTNIHARLFGLERHELKRAYFKWLGNYKTCTMVFSVVPYLALKLA